MPEGKLKSRSKRRVFKRTPGAKTVKHFIAKKPAKATCGMCGKPLSGVPRATKAQLNNMPKTQKRPERPFGGVLCTICSRIVIKEESRFKEKQ
jgi:large subunit ribosomal protein L34e